MSKPTLIVFPDLLKSHVDQYVRKDGVVVQAHDDKRQAAAPKPAAGGHTTSTLNVLADQHSGEAARHDKLATKKGVGHPDYDHHVDASSMHTRLQYHAENARDAANGSAERASHLAEHARIKSKVEAVEAKIGASGASAPKPAGSPYAAARSSVMMAVSKDRHPAAKKMLDDMEAGGDHAEEFGKYHFGAAHEAVKGALKKHGIDVGGGSAAEPKLALPVKKATAKTGSAAPAKTVNVGSEKWPMHAKSSEKLAAKHDDGSTHHVGGFEAPSNGKGDHTIHHDGKPFSFTGKSGKNTKTGEASYEYAHHGDNMEHRAWVTHSGHLMND